MGRLIHVLLHEVFLFSLTFCNSNLIHHIYCDIMPLLKVPCTDPSLILPMLSIFPCSIQVFTILTIFVLYTLVLCSIFKQKSVKVIKKAFSTYEQNLLSLSLCCLSVFMYRYPASPQIDDQDMMDSVFNTAIIPVLNPITYTLINKKVKNCWQNS